MIEPIMFFGLGFLASSLLGLIIVPFVHGRAVRLTVRRLEAATPLSMAEIQADKDQLRAEFAMSTRRLEMSVEQLKTKIDRPARGTRQEERRHQPAQDRARREGRDHLRAGSARQGHQGPAARDRGRARGQDQHAARDRAQPRRQGSRARQGDRLAHRPDRDLRQPARRDRRAQDPGRQFQGPGRDPRARREEHRGSLRAREGGFREVAARSSPTSAAPCRRSARASRSSSASSRRRPPKPRSWDGASPTWKCG